jgi:hypothetical protein
LRSCPHSCTFFEGCNLLPVCRAHARVHTHTHTHTPHGFSSGTVVTVSEGLDLLRSNEIFALALGAHVASVAPAVFWECPPVSQATVSQQPFEFVVLPAKRLEGVEADPSTFSAHFVAADGPCHDGDADGSAGRESRTRGQLDRTHTMKSGSGAGGRVASFTNLGGDATLVVPCPHPSAPRGYAHLAVFLRDAPKSQRVRFWAALAERVTDELAARGAHVPLWTSTSGLGVYWLHVRLDSRPKYYQYQPFTRWPRLPMTLL